MTSVGLTGAIGTGAGSEVTWFSHLSLHAGGDLSAPIIVMPGAGSVPVGKKPLPKNLTTNVPFVLSGLSGTVADVQVVLYLLHSDTYSLTIALLHPDNTSVTLASGITGSDFGLASDPIIFDDSASVTVGPSNRKGRVKPTTLLAALKGKDPNGTWRLRVTNDSGVYDGSLEAATLFVGSTAPGGGGSVAPSRSRGIARGVG